jgi:hypothetical protein
MAMSDAELAAIKSARASGVSSVSYLGRTVTYRSLEDMDKIISQEDSRRSGGRVSFFRTKFRKDSGC